MPDLEDFTISIASLVRSRELADTLRMLESFPNIQVILDGADLGQYDSVIQTYQKKVRFVYNKRSLGVAAVWNQGIIVSNTRYVILSSDHLFYPPNWFEGLRAALTAGDPPSQVSLSWPMSFSCFCLDKSLVVKQGWFDQNFTRAYFEDEDWYLRSQENLSRRSPASNETLIPLLKAVQRPARKYTPANLWNPLPNKIYFQWKWRRTMKTAEACLYSREAVPYQRRLSEPTWPTLTQARTAYKQGNFQSQPWTYSPPRWEMRLLTWLTSLAPFIALRERYLKTRRS